MFAGSFLILFSIEKSNCFLLRGLFLWIWTTSCTVDMSILLSSQLEWKTNSSNSIQPYTLRLLFNLDCVYFSVKHYFCLTGISHDWIELKWSDTDLYCTIVDNMKNDKAMERTQYQRLRVFTVQSADKQVPIKMKQINTETSTMMDTPF